MKNTAQKIFINDPVRGQRLAGTLKETKSGLVFRKSVNRSKHFMRVVQGYGMQKELFDTYLRGKKGRIEIKETDTGKFLVASVDTWTEHARAGNYGDGKQIFLSERFMHGADNFSRVEVNTKVISIDARLQLRDIAEDLGIYKQKELAFS